MGPHVRDVHSGVSDFHDLAHDARTVTIVQNNAFIDEIIAGRVRWIFDILKYLLEISKTAGIFVHGALGIHGSISWLFSVCSLSFVGCVALSGGGDDFCPTGRGCGKTQNSKLPKT